MNCVWSDEAQQAEAVQMLTAILELEERQSAGSVDVSAGNVDETVNESSETAALVCHSLAMFYYLLNDNDKATFSVLLFHSSSATTRCWGGGGVGFEATLMLSKL